MADGFKIADAFVDVKAVLDESSITAAAESAGKKSGAKLEEALAASGKSSGGKFGSSFGSSSESRLSDSRSKFVKDFDGIGEGAGKSSGGKFGDSFGANLLGKVAGTGAKMGSSLMGTLGEVGGKGGPYMMAGIAAAVAVGAPLAGATLGAALTAGVAGAGIGIGVAAAMRVPQVRAAAVGLSATFSDELGKIGREWAPTMISAIGQIKGQIPGIGALIRSSIAPAQGYLAPLIDGFTGLVRNILPGMNSLIGKAGPVISVLSDGLKRVGEAIGNAMESVSGETDNMAAGLEYFIEMLAQGIEFAGDMTAALAAGFGHVLDFITPLVSFFASIPGVGKHFEGWEATLKQVQATAHGSRSELAGASSSFTQLEGTVSKASATNERMAIRQQILNGTMAQGADAAGDLKGAMDALNGAAQNAEQAEIAMKESVKAATEALKENGRTTDINTEKGRANRTALLQLAQAGQTHAQAQYDQTAATRGTAAAEQVAQGAYARSRASLIETAQKMGMSRSAAIAYADKIMAIPKSWTTNITANTGNAIDRLASVRSYMASLKDKNINVRVTVSKHGEVIHGNQASAYMSTGGPVIGPGVKGVDSVRTVLAPGEHVWTDKEVDAAGGHAAVARMRQALRAGATAGTPRSMAPRQTDAPQALAPRNPPKASIPAHPGSSSGNSGGGSDSGGSSGGGDTYYIGTVTIDASQVRSIQQLADLVSGIVTSSRTLRARTAAPAGA